MKNILFLRSGTKYSMRILFSDTGGYGYTYRAITFRDNLLTRGDGQGTIPLMMFHGQGGFGQMDITVVGAGLYDMALVAISDNNSVSVMFAMQWMIVP